MLELRRNQTEAGFLYDYEKMQLTIQPWDWYWYETGSGQTYDLDTVKAWKDYGNRYALLPQYVESQLLEQEHRVKLQTYRVNAQQDKFAFIDTLFKQE